MRHKIGAKYPGKGVSSSFGESDPLTRSVESASGVKGSHPRNGQGPGRNLLGQAVRCTRLRSPLRPAFEVVPKSCQAITRDVSESSR